MLKLTCLPLLFVLAQPLAAQFDHPFPDSAAAWTNAYYYYPPPPPGPTLQWTVSYCATGEDTLINGIAYKKIIYCNGAYKGALRTEPGKVFFLPADSLQEFNLYDFTLNAGDTIHNVYIEDHDEFSPEPSVTTMVINSVWVEDGRRHLYSSNGPYWIEGIGSQTGLFWGSGANISNYLIELACMSINDSVVFSSWNTSVTGCPFFMGMSELRVTLITVHPNPTSGLVTVSIDLGANVTVKLSDHSGRELSVPYRKAIGSLEIDLSGLADGLYYATFVERDQTSFARVIKQ